MLEKNAITSAEDWYFNPLCKVIVGFRNYTTHATRSKYVSFSIENEKEMCELLLLLSFKKLSKDKINAFSERLFDQLINYGLLKPIHSLTFSEKIKNSLNLLNENRHSHVYYKGNAYAVTSFIFMAFYSQRPNEHLRETIVLPFWSKKFCQKVYEALSSSNKKLTVNASARHIKRMLKHGLISKQQDLPDINTYFQRDCVLSENLFVNLPEHCKDMLFVPSKNEKLIINSQIYLNDSNSVPLELASSIYDAQWALDCKPSVWIKHPITQIVSMYWLNEKQLSQLKQLINQTITPEMLDEQTFKLFSYIHVIDSEEYLMNEAKAWQEKLVASKDKLTHQGCVIIRDILATPELAIAQSYLRHLYHKKYLLRDKANGSTKERYWIHRDNFTLHIHHQISIILNQFLPSPVKVGHNGITIYKPGAVLPNHIDDVLAFKYVMSLPVDTDPVKDIDNAWPIHIKTPDDVVYSAKLRMGDGHLIDPQMPHWRDELSDHTLGILLLWFVPHDFKGYVNGNWID